MKATLTKHLVDALREWYIAHARDLPWRHTSEPYHIWLSEVILQQTRVEQGMPYYERFIHLFPTVHDLAQADETEVMKAWEGLGYYSRARNLHRCAQVVSRTLAGVFPETAEALQKLPGIGPYTSAAIASICHDEPVPVMDGNVIRFLTRLYGIEERIDTAAVKKLIFERALPFVERDAGMMNQALMEYGARACTPRSPHCSDCPFAERCVALSIQAIDRIPLKKKKAPRKQRYFDYLLIRKAGRILIQRRSEGDVWAGLYEFPLIEYSNKHPGKEDGVAPIGEVFKQTLSHQDIHARFLLRAADDINKFSPPAQWVDLQDLKTLAFPRVIRTFLEIHSAELHS